MDVTSKTLILCVDQDNDVGKWTGVTTPIIGKGNTIEAATNLAIADPEEADANAMFGAVRILNRMTHDHPDEEFQIATITGTLNGGVEADRKMMKELADVLRQFPADGLILVTDGFVDDSIKPIIQSRIPITSVQHIVVKHSERIEETYLIFFKYLKMLVDDPYYSRIALGVPGVLLIIFGFLLASNQLQNAGLAVTFVVGIVFFVKGFGIYNRALEFKPILPPPETQTYRCSSCSSGRFPRHCRRCGCSALKHAAILGSCILGRSNPGASGELYPNRCRLNCIWCSCCIGRKRCFLLHSEK
jgi:putative membrane protein